MRGAQRLALWLLAGVLMAVPWLKVSPNGHTFVDGNASDAPFFPIGDSPHALYAGWDVLNGGNTDAISAVAQDAYLDDRETRLFNALELTPCYYDHDTDLWGPNNSGVRPFVGNDISQPVDAFWNGLGTLISDLGSRSMAAFLNPLWFGFANNPEDAYQYQLASQEAKLRGFGRYVGAKLASYDNIVYCLAGDQTYSNKNIARQLAYGILDADTGKQKLMTAWCARGTTALTQCPGDAWSRVNFGYTIGDNRLYQQARTAYTGSYRQPYFVGEAWFEGESRRGVDGTTCTAQEIRRQPWWGLTSGACGHFFGNGPLWLFGSGYSLSTTGATEFGTHFRAFLTGRAWHKLVPDTSHTVVTSGYGTDGNDDHATCARTPDGSLVVIYTPTTNSPVVDMTKLKGVTNIRRYNPTSGAYTTFNGTAANTGTQTLTHPGSNGNANDWVWVLEA